MASAVPSRSASRCAGLGFRPHFGRLKTVSSSKGKSSRHNSILGRDHCMARVTVTLFYGHTFSSSAISRKKMLVLPTPPICSQLRVLAMSSQYSLILARSASKRILIRPFLASAVSISLETVRLRPCLPTWRCGLSRWPMPRSSFFSALVSDVGSSMIWETSNIKRQRSNSEFRRIENFARSFSLNRGSTRPARAEAEVQRAQSHVLDCDGGIFDDFEAPRLRVAVGGGETSSFQQFTDDDVAIESDLNLRMLRRCTMAS